MLRLPVNGDLDLNKPGKLDATDRSTMYANCPASLAEKYCLETRKPTRKIRKPSKGGFDDSFIRRGPRTPNELQKLSLGYQEA